MSDPVAWERQQVDEVFVEVVRQFRRRPKWRHILAVVLGAVHSARAARKLRGGYCPGGAQALPGLGWGGYVRRVGPSSNVTTRVRAGRGEWVVALQLRAGTTDDPTPQLAAAVAHALDQLEWACAQ